MITWDQSITNCQDTAQDYSTTGLAFFKRRLNDGYKKVLAEFGVQQNERTQTSSTVANQQYYQVPYDLIAPKSITVTVGSIVYPVTWVESQQAWDEMNMYTNRTATVPFRAFYRPRFGVNGGDIGIYPIPSASTSTISLVYTATDKNLSQTAYTTGTVTVTSNSATVTGSGVTWNAQMVGRYFQVTDSGGNTDGQFYRIVSVISATQLTLEQTYENTTASGLTYQIAEMFALPEEMQVLPEYYALWHYYLTKQSKDKALTFEGMFKQELSVAKVTWAKRVRNNKIRPTRRSYAFPNAVPYYYPSGGISS